MAAKVEVTEAQIEHAIEVAGTVGQDVKNLLYEVKLAQISLKNLMAEASETFTLANVAEPPNQKRMMEANEMGAAAYVLVHAIRNAVWQ